MSAGLPDVLVPYKYVMFSWRNSPSLKKDGLARKFFDAHVTPASLPALLGSPMKLYETRTKPTKSPELFFSLDQCNALISQLAVSMGPTRAAASFKEEMKFTRADMTTAVKTHEFRTPRDVEVKLKSLERGDNELATKASAEMLEGMRLIFEKAWAGKGDAAFFAIDVETWEHDHNLLTEFGWSSLVVRAGQEVRDDQHIVVAENAHRRNGRYCPDARDHFDFGTTETVPAIDLLSTLSTLFSTLSASAPLFLIMHDPRSDLVALELLGIDPYNYLRDISAFKPSKSKIAPVSGIWVIDTQVLYSGWKREKQQTKLGTCCTVLEIAMRRLHNAGNDARYTLEVFEQLMNRSRSPP